MKSSKNYLKKAIWIVLAWGLIIQWAFALNVSKEIQDLKAFIQAISFTDNGSPDWANKISISAVWGIWTNNNWAIFLSWDFWAGKWWGNSLYVNSTSNQVWIWTTNLSEKLTVWGNIRIWDSFSVKMWLNWDSYIKWNWTQFDIIGQWNLVINWTRNYIRWGTVAFWSTWFDESDNSYYIDPNNTSVFNNISASQVKATCLWACF